MRHAGRQRDIDEDAGVAAGADPALGEGGGAHVALDIDRTEGRQRRSEVEAAPFEVPGRARLALIADEFGQADADRAGRPRSVRRPRAASRRPWRRRDRAPRRRLPRKASAASSRSAPPRRRCARGRPLSWCRRHRRRSHRHRPAHVIHRPQPGRHGVRRCGIPRRSSPAMTDRMRWPAIAADRRSRLPSPQTIMAAAFDSSAMEAMPMVMPCEGTSSSDLKSGKVARLSRRVCSASSTTRLLLSRGEPGGLKAIWPSPAPEASRKRSMPPAAARRRS